MWQAACLTVQVIFCEAVPAVLLSLLPFSLPHCQGHRGLSVTLRNFYGASESSCSLAAESSLLLPIASCIPLIEFSKHASKLLQWLFQTCLGRALGVRV